MKKEINESQLGRRKSSVMMMMMMTMWDFKYGRCVFLVFVSINGRPFRESWTRFGQHRSETRCPQLYILQSQMLVLC